MAETAPSATQTRDTQIAMLETRFSLLSTDDVYKQHTRLRYYQLLQLHERCRLAVLYPRELGCSPESLPLHDARRVLWDQHARLFLSRHLTLSQAEQAGFEAVSRFDPLDHGALFVLTSSGSLLAISSLSKHARSRRVRYLPLNGRHSAAYREFETQLDEPLVCNHPAQIGILALTRITRMARHRFQTPTLPIDATDESVMMCFTPRASDLLEPRLRYNTQRDELRRMHRTDPARSFSEAQLLGAALVLQQTLAQHSPSYLLEDISSFTCENGSRYVLPSSSVVERAKRHGFSQRWSDVSIHPQRVVLGAPVCLFANTPDDGPGVLVVGTGMVQSVTLRAPINS